MTEDLRQKYQMDEEQYQRLLDACKPVPYMVFGGMPPTSPQENANRAWETLGKEMGFQHMTVRPDGANARNFTAIPITAKES